MNKLFLVIISIFIISKCYSQSTNDTLDHTGSLRVNLLGLTFNSISVFIDQKVYKNNYIEASFGYMFPNYNTGNKFMLFYDNDPFWYYSRIKAGIGINHHFKNHFYLGSYIKYKHSNLKKTIFENYINYEGDAADEDWEISKKKQELGLYFKTGYAEVLVKHFIFDIYFSLGVRRIYSTENIWSKVGFNGPLSNDYPINSKYVNFFGDMALGISIGICK